jgi:GAF domain-containing protein
LKQGTLSCSNHVCVKENNKLMQNTKNIAAELERCLVDDGLRGALAYLNRRVPHRFTALHIRDFDVLKNVYVYDRDDPAAKPFMNLPVYETFCALVLANGQPLVINHAEMDPEATQPVHNAVARSYCGVPLHRPDGSIFGTLCHYDFDSGEIGTAELAILSTASQILSATLNNIAAL